MPKVYDPVKAHLYYERTKQLKGREKGSSRPKASGRQSTTQKVASQPKGPKAQARVGRLRSKVKTLTNALDEAQTALRQKQQDSRESARKEKKERSDGKSTAKEKQASKEYRDKHQSEIKAKRKKDGSSKSSGGSSKSSSKSVSDMSVQELRSRVTKIKSALRDAKRQLSNANNELGQLAHSAITSEPDVNEHFAQFKSAERIPSK